MDNNKPEERNRQYCSNHNNQIQKYLTAIEFSEHLAQRIIQPLNRGRLLISKQFIEAYITKEILYLFSALYSLGLLRSQLFSTIQSYQEEKRHSISAFALFGSFIIHMVRLQRNCFKRNFVGRFVIIPERLIVLKKIVISGNCALRLLIPK